MPNYSQAYFANWRHKQIDPNMLVVAKFANTKWWKKLKTDIILTLAHGYSSEITQHELSKNTNMPGFRRFSKNLGSCTLDKSSLSIRRVKKWCQIIVRLILPTGVLNRLVIPLCIYSPFPSHSSNPRSLPKANPFHGHKTHNKTPPAIKLHYFISNWAVKVPLGNKMLFYK